MKYKWDNHFFADHSNLYALSKSSGGPLESGTCEKCQLPFKYLHYIGKMVSVIHLFILDHTKQRLKLYLGHCVCMLNQCQNIDELIQRTSDVEIWIVMDYKMKFEAMYFIQKTTKFFDKKEDLWHASMVYMRYTTTLAKNFQSCHIFYFDHIFKFILFLTLKFFD